MPEGFSSMYQQDHVLKHVISWLTLVTAGVPAGRVGRNSTPPVGVKSSQVHAALHEHTRWLQPRLSHVRPDHNLLYMRWPLLAKTYTDHTSSVSSGIGYATQVVIAYAAVSYIVIQAWAFFYLFSSFSAEVPWASCRNAWNTGTHADRCRNELYDTRLHPRVLSESLGLNGYREISRKCILVWRIDLLIGFSAALYSNSQKGKYHSGIIKGSPNPKLSLAIAGCGACGLCSFAAFSL